MPQGEYPGTDQKIRGIEPPSVYIGLGSIVRVPSAVVKRSGLFLLGTNKNLSGSKPKDKYFVFFVENWKLRFFYSKIFPTTLVEEIS